jgi:hypothetical protein
VVITDAGLNFDPFDNGDNYLRRSMAVRDGYFDDSKRHHQLVDTRAPEPGTPTDVLTTIRRDAGGRNRHPAN